MKLRFIQSLSSIREHSLMYRVVGEKIYLEVHTKRNAKSGNFGKEKKYWYHIDDPKTHKTYKEAAKFKCKD